MKKLVLVLVLIIVAVAVASQLPPLKQIRPAWIVPGNPEMDTQATQPPSTQPVATTITVNGTAQKLSLPEGYSINVYAQNLGKPRFMAADAGTLYVSIPSQGKVVALPDRNRDGVADETVTVVNNLQLPHGLAFYQKYLYIAWENGVTRVKDTNGDLTADITEPIVTSFPFGAGDTAGKGHNTRTIGFDPQGFMYVSVGSSCNVCEDKGRGVIMRFKADGSNPDIFGLGLRNAVGFVFHPQTGELWATENGRDLLSDDFPPDEINIVTQGNHYGWPYCNGDQIPDPDFDKNKREFCQTTEAPHILLQAHSAPLGLRFIDGKLYVAYHGSWNRSVPTGYKIVMIDPATKIVTDWITGWLVGGKAWGRPVDIIESDGAIFISDDFAGVIYRLFRN